MKRAYRRSDGSVASANTPSASKSYIDSDSRIYKCVLTKIYYTDDPKNPSKGSVNPEVVYDGIVVGGRNEGQKIDNIRDAKFLTGGKDNYQEHIYRVNSKPFTGPQGVDLSQQDGDMVYVAFIVGLPGFPVIIGSATNQLDAEKTGATIADGPRKRWEYNGIFFEITKTGTLELTRKGGLFNETDNRFEPEVDAAKHKLTLRLTEAHFALDANQGAVKVDVDGGTEEAPAESVTLTFKSGLIVTIDGVGDKITMTTGGGAKTEIDGKSDKLTHSSAGGGKVEIQAGSKIIVESGLIELGEGATESVVLGDSFKIYFDQHIHPTGVGPSGPPTTPMPPTTLSDQTKAKK